MRALELSVSRTPRAYAVEQGHSPAGCPLLGKMQSGLSGFIFLAGLEKPARVIFEACGMFVHKRVPANCQY